MKQNILVNHLAELNEFLKNKKRKSSELKLTNVCPQYMIELAEKAGIELDTDNIETNGWQLDYWITGTYEGKKLTVGGGAWYGEGQFTWE